MAILKKRTSSKQIPDARGFDRAPLSSVINNFNNARPDLEGTNTPFRGSTTVIPAGTTPINKPPINGTTSGSGTSINNPVLTSTTTKPTVNTKPTSITKPTVNTKPTSITKPTVNTKPTSITKPTVTTKPATTKPTDTTTPTTKTPTVTTKTPTTPTTKTTSPTSVVKQTVTPTKTNTNSTANKVVNALTGAAIGAGTKLLFDKLTGKPVTNQTSNTNSGSKNPTSIVKAPATKGGSGGSSVPSKTGSSSGSKTSTDGKTTLPSATDLYKGKPADPSLGLPAGSIDNGDGTYTVPQGDGSSVTYSMDGDKLLYSTDTDGKIIVSKDAISSPTSGTKVSADDEALAQEAGLSPGETILNPNGTTITAIDDGNGGVMYVYGGYDSESGLGPKGGVTPTRSLGGTDTKSDVNVANNETVYFQDAAGNIYTQNADGGYDLYANADGSLATDTTFADNTWVDPDTGDVWNMASDGTWSMEGSDTTLADNTDYTDYTDYTLADNTDYTDYTDSDSVEVKRGGLITMMKKGGVPEFEVPDGAEDNGDGTFTLDNNVFDIMTGDPLYTIDNNGKIIYTEPSANSNYVDNGDGTYTIGDITYDVATDMPLYSDNAKGGVDLAKDNGDGTYTIGKNTYDMNTNELLYATNPKTGAIDVSPNAIRSVGSGSRSPTLGNYLNKTADSIYGVGKDALDAITSALGTTAGAAGAGALISSLLGSDFGGGTGAQNQGLDMSKVGVINPRTTDFGIGPTNFVGYDQYGTEDGTYTPNEELLHNLNAPGYNPVNEGDYGYAPDDGSQTVDDQTANDTQVPSMASGGLSAMSTPVASYYTFGQPADILANLGMRQQPPQNPPAMMPQVGQQQSPLQSANPQSQQQGQQMQKQMPDQITQQTQFGAPQQTIMAQSDGVAPKMRRGGLPHYSDVPLVEGRMDFRNGSAVHGEGDGQSDDIPAMLADGEYVIDAETVAQIGNGSTKAGAQALDKFREGIRAHKRSAPLNKIPPKTKALTSYLKGAR